MRRRAYLAGVGSGGLLALAGCTALADGLLSGDDYDVGMTRHSFEPEVYETRVGEPVVWKNTSEARHTVTAYEGSIPDGASYVASGGFESEEEAREEWHANFGGKIDTGERFEHTLEVPGSYAYFCIPHEIDGRDDAWMTGVVEVTD